MASFLGLGKGLPPIWLRFATVVAGVVVFVALVGCSVAPIPYALKSLMCVGWMGYGDPPPDPGPPKIRKSV